MNEGFGSKLEEANNQLNNIKLRYETKFDLLKEGVQIIDYNWRYLYVNDATAWHGKTTKQELLGHTMMEKYPGIELTDAFKVLRQVMTERKPQKLENEFEYPDKSKRYFELNIEPVEEGILILSLDITERHEAEEKTKRANQLYAFISQVNQNIVRVKDQETLFRNACRIALEFGKFKMAWIGLFDGEKKRIRLAEQYGISSTEIILFADIPIKPNGPKENILKTGKYYLSNDVDNNPELEYWRSYINKHKIRSCLILPIRKSGNIIGLFSLYSGELNFFDKEEVALLVDVAGDISFALDLLEKAKKHKETKELATKNEKKFRHTLDNMLEGVQIHDFNWRYIYVNDALVDYSTYTREELIGHTLMEKYPGLEQTDVYAAAERCMKDRVDEYLETDFIFPDGTTKYFELSIKPIPEGIFILSIDRTEKKKIKQRLMKANRLYSFISAINQSIVHIDNEKELLDNACEIAVNIGQFKMAMAELLGEQTGKLNIISSSGDADAIKDGEKYSGVDYTLPELQDTPTGKVLLTGKYALTNDAQNDPAMKPWKAELVKNGIQSIITFPIKKFGKTIGVFDFISTVQNFFDEEEIMLLEEAVNDISFALEIFEKTQKHKETEELLVKNERRFRAMIENGLDIISLRNQDGKLFYISPSITTVLGYSVETLVGSVVFNIIHPEDLPGLQEQTKLILKTPGASFNREQRYLHKNGNWVWCVGTVTNMLHEPGINALVSNFRDISGLKETERQLIKSEAFNRGVLNSLSSHIAVISHSGNIVAANEAWKRFGTVNGKTSLQRIEVKKNYFELCETLAKQGDKIAEEALQGMKDVMNDKETIFYMEYPCHSPHKERWFAMRVTKFDSEKPMIVVAHMNITKLKKVQEERDNTLLDLEHRVEKRTKELVDKNLNILDSINYAKRIQLGLLTHPSQLTELFPNSFILSQPRDIVSGDFFWCYERHNKKFVALADCTGHGVPGALMSIIGNNLLNHIVVDEHIENPSEILELLDIRLKQALKGDTEEVKDGMDITFCMVDTYFNELYFAGAHHPLYISDEHGKLRTITEHASSTNSIGGELLEIQKKFETKRFPILPGQRVYLTSDGYSSQFGGPQGRKFMKSRFKQTLEELQEQPIKNQRKLLKQILKDWAGDNEQVDDVMVIGIEM
jgi:PAS domain S-box-containing protein